MIAYIPGPSLGSRSSTSSCVSACNRVALAGDSEKAFLIVSHSCSPKPDTIGQETSSDHADCEVDNHAHRTYARNYGVVHKDWKSEFTPSDHLFVFHTGSFRSAELYTAVYKHTYRREDNLYTAVYKHTYVQAGR